MTELCLVWPNQIHIYEYYTRDPWYPVSHSCFVNSSKDFLFENAKYIVYKVQD